MNQAEEVNKWWRMDEGVWPQIAPPLRVQVGRHQPQGEHTRMADMQLGDNTGREQNPRSMPPARCAEERM